MSKTIRLLYEKSDAAMIAPVLEKLKEKGIKLIDSEKEYKPGETVLAILSEAFYRNAEKEDTLIRLIGAGAKSVLPLKVDDVPFPETLNKALSARNIIFSEGRDPEQITERILSALPKKKNILPVILSVIGVAVLAVAGILIYRTLTPEPEPVIEEPTPRPTEKPAEISLPFGLTAEDLKNITQVNIVGEEAHFYTSEQVRKMEHLPEWDELAYRTYENGQAHYYSRQDGHEYTMTRYEDLSFVSLMPNLQYLYLSLVDCDSLPDLTQSERLRIVFLCDTNISRLDWLSGSAMHTIHILNGSGTVNGFGALTACKNLEEVHIDLDGMESADFSGFCPEKLSWLWINNGHRMREEVDLSGLQNAKNLTECMLEGVPVRDLSFLEKADGLAKLELENMDLLEDISALDRLQGVERISIVNCRRIADYFPIRHCTDLRYFNLVRGEGENMLRDASFLADLPKISEIRLYGCDLDNFDFLEGLANNHRVITLCFSGRMKDYSGLSYLKNYTGLEAGMDGQDFSRIAPYLKEIKVSRLEIDNVRNLDLSLLPNDLSELYISGADIRDLSGIKNYALTTLELHGNRNLRSLKGIENLRSLYYQSGGLNLSVDDCPYLYDYSALDGASLFKLSLSNLYELPSLDRFTIKALRLENIGGLEDLSVLDALSNKERYSRLEFVGLDKVTDLSPVKRLRAENLVIPPQLAAQAEDLKNLGVVWSYEVQYPEGNWNPLDNPLVLTSLEELETFPKSLLAKIESVAVCGQFVETDGFNYWWEGDTRSKKHPTVYIHTWHKDEPEKLEYGSITDVSIFKDLTGLKQLKLINQPLTTLEGIQEFSELEELTVACCWELKDVSAVFSLQGLKGLNLQGAPITSIQGVQNLSELNSLELSDTQIKDLGPFYESDFISSHTDEGFDFGFTGTPCTDLQPLKMVAHYSMLKVFGHPVKQWLEAVRETRIDGVMVHVESNDMLKKLTEQHPELVSMHIQRSTDVTDLTPLLSLEQLEYVRISSDMKKAIKSLEGAEYRFELEIEE